MKIGRHLCFKSSFAFLMAQRVKNLPTMQETQEDTLEEGMATHYQYSCLENSMNRGVWWAPVRGVVRSQK